MQCLFFSSVTIYLFPQTDHIGITLVKQNWVLITFGIQKAPGTNA